MNVPGCVPEVRPSPLRQDLVVQPAVDPVGGWALRIKQGPRVPCTQVKRKYSWIFSF